MSTLMSLLSVGTILSIVVGSLMGAIASANGVNLEHTDTELVTLSGHSSSEEQRYIRPSITCPSDITDLLPLLLRDLPSYANRVSTRAQVSERSFNPRGVVIAAAQAPEDQPAADSAADRVMDGSVGGDEGGDRDTDRQERLPDRNHQFADRWANVPGIPSPEEIVEHQLIPVFFTTLERQYVDGGAVRLQHYHWAFLSRYGNRWHLALMFSRLGDYPAHQPVSPPRESRQGTIGQALQLWLRDCNAGAVEGL